MRNRTMSGLLSLLLTVVPAGQPDAHLPINPMYRQLREKGVIVPKKLAIPLPSPVMADGLSAEAQKAAIEKLLNQEIDLEEFEGKRNNAPIYLERDDPKGNDPDAPPRGYHVYFVAYGELSKLADKDFLNGLARKRKQGEGKTLKDADLAKRGINVPKDVEKYESYGWSTFIILDRVELEQTGRSYWTQTADSLVFASEIDPRFNKDSEFPNRWRSVEKVGDGELKKGPYRPYDGAGYYFKATRLHEPKGALFVESHLIFSQPNDWFDDPALLTSKMAPIMRDMAKTLREDLKK
jgi:hypothetical protein